MDNSNLRFRLENYEFSDEQELKLTLELINRIENDINTIKGDRSSDGYTTSASIAGLAGALYLLFSESGKLTEFPFVRTASVLLAMLLIGKLFWTFYQLAYFDSPSLNSQDANRFRWTNHFLYDQRMNVFYQITIFVLSIILLFFLTLPIWVIIASGLSFAIYILLLAAVFIFSYKNEAFSEHNENKLFKIILPILVIITSIISAIGLLKPLPFPISGETSPFLLAGIIFAILFFLNVAIVLSSPSLLLTKLQKLRRDIIFLKLELKDAWILYEIYMEGNELTEEMRSLVEDVANYFSQIDSLQSQNLERLKMAREEIKKLKEAVNLSEKDFADYELIISEFGNTDNTISIYFKEVESILREFGKKLNKISNTTKEYEKADNYRKYVFDRLVTFKDKDEAIITEKNQVNEEIKPFKAKLPFKKDN